LLQRIDLHILAFTAILLGKAIFGKYQKHLDRFLPVPIFGLMDFMGVEDTMHGIYPHAAHSIGRDHILAQKNYQDAHALIQTDTHIIGVICDGCGEGVRSEVGAALAAEFIAARASDLLESGICPARLPPLLYTATVDFLKGLIELLKPTNPAQFSMD